LKNQKWRKNMLKSEIDIENLPAGPEIDELIAVEIFQKIALTQDEIDVLMAGNYISACRINPIKFFKRPRTDPHPETKLMFDLEWQAQYSREENASRYVVAEMRQAGWLFDLCDYEIGEDETTKGKIVKSAGFTKCITRGEGWADTDELAIARAALIAVREENRALASASK
jgi:hypothetical protein